MFLIAEKQLRAKFVKVIKNEGLWTLCPYRLHYGCDFVWNPLTQVPSQVQKPHFLQSTMKSTCPEYKWIISQCLLFLERHSWAIFTISAAKPSLCLPRCLVHHESSPEVQISAILLSPEYLRTLQCRFSALREWPSWTAAFLGSHFKDAP